MRGTQTPELPQVLKLFGSDSNPPNSLDVVVQHRVFERASLSPFSLKSPLRDSSGLTPLSLT